MASAAILAYPEFDQRKSPFGPATEPLEKPVKPKILSPDEEKPHYFRQNDYFLALKWFLAITQSASWPPPLGVEFVPASQIKHLTFRCATRGKVNPTLSQY